LAKGGLGPSYARYRQLKNKLNISPVVTDRCHLDKRPGYIDILAKGEKFCVGGKLPHQYAIDYTRDFFLKYENYQKFGKICSF
jgi:hypothetical protein